MTKITRIEVIDENGRSYVNWEDDNDVSWQFQDGGRTLKVFVDKVKPKSPVEEAYKKVFGYYPVTDVGDAYWEYFQNGYNAAKEEELEDNEWKSVALRFGEELSDVGPCGYYEFTAEEWFDWVVNTYEKICDDTVKLLKKEKVKKSKINDLAEKLLPDDHPYKIADEHGETNPYKQYLNSVEDEKKMEELGFVKNSDGSWTARPLGETAQERGERVHKEMEEKLQEKDWEIKVETDYRTGKARHKTRIVDKDGNDYKPEPLTTEELLKPKWEPKSQSEEEVADGLKEAFREAVKQGIIHEVDKVNDVFMMELNNLINWIKLEHYKNED